MITNRTLTTVPFNDQLNLSDWVGQREATFTFMLSDGGTGENLGEVHPLRGATLTHDTTRTIKRQLSVNFGVADTAFINTVTALLTVSMDFPDGTSYPLGTYRFTDSNRQVYTSGKLGSTTLNDNMFIVDQPITIGINGVGTAVSKVIQTVLADFDIVLKIEPSPYVSSDAWTVGTSRGQILEALAVTGDYFSPWFGNDEHFHMIRTFDPATQVPSFDFDRGHQVLRQGIVESDDLLLSPNRIFVISNSSTKLNQAPITASADIPANAPNSIRNRGFVLPKFYTLPISDQSQCQAVASGLAQRHTVFEQVSLSTAPDPRHDSYDVIQWQGDLWLELGWSMQLIEGGTMSHVLRKSYTP
jgi:hypothetical protein